VALALSAAAVAEPVFAAAEVGVDVPEVLDADDADVTALVAAAATVEVTAEPTGVEVAAEPAATTEPV